MILLLLALQDPLAVRADTVRPVHDALHYELSISVPDTGTRIRGEAEVTWRITSTAPIRLALDSVFTVSRAAWSGERRMLRREWIRRGDLIEIPQRRRVGDTVVTRLEYAGSPRDGLVIHADVHGDRTAFADNWPDRAHRWFPAQDHPSDKATVSFNVEVPRGWRAIAVGALERVDTLPGERTLWHYRMAEPVPVYTMVFGAGVLSVTRLADATCPHCAPSSVWAYPEDSVFAVTGPFRRAPEIVRYFARLVGPFPYAGLAHVESSTLFGGMENASAIFYNEKAYADRTMDEQTVAHETAHQWFGDAVTESDWHHLWLSEGFATYFAALWAGHVGGDTALERVMQGGAASVFTSPVTDRPILDSAADNLMGLLNSNNYPKGAWVLHQLRGLIGDSAFFRGIATYYTRYRNGNALSSDFAAAMEAGSGQDLHWYFMQALTQPGYPVLEVRWSYAEHHLSVAVRQVQKAAWGTYRIPGLELRAGERIYRLDLTGPDASADFDDVPAEPAALEVDPHGHWLLQATVSRVE